MPKCASFSLSCKKGPEVAYGDAPEPFFVAGLLRVFIIKNAARDDFVDQAIFKSSFGSHEVITFRISLKDVDRLSSHVLLPRFGSAYLSSEGYGGQQFQFP